MSKDKFHWQNPYYCRMMFDDAVCGIAVDCDAPFLLTGLGGLDLIKALLDAQELLEDGMFQRVDAAEA